MILLQGETQEPTRDPTPGQSWVQHTRPDARPLREDAVAVPVSQQRGEEGGASSRARAPAPPTPASHWWRF